MEILHFQNVWSPLRDSVLEPQQKLAAMQLPNDLFKDASKQVMNCMMGHIELPAMMAKVVGDFNFSRGKFGDVKDLVIGMLNTYNYEKVLAQFILLPDHLWAFRTATIPFQHDRLSLSHSIGFTDISDSYEHRLQHA